jgi:hypothetical protein
MSRIADILYFAPGVTFSDLDLSGNRLPDQFRQRINGFYLKPAKHLAYKHSFAAGVLVICAMDALGGLLTGSKSTESKIKSLCRKIPGLSTEEAAEIFHESFRNGLVHNARIKNGSEFSADIGKVAVLDHGRLVVNPGLLADAVERELDEYVRDLYQNPAARKTLASRIRKKFKYELTQ